MTLQNAKKKVLTRRRRWQQRINAVQVGSWRTNEEMLQNAEVQNVFTQE